MTSLRQITTDAMLLRGYAERTQHSYLYAIERLARYYRRNPSLLSRDEIQAYFLYVIKTRHWSPASCRLSMNAFRFLYIDVLKWKTDTFLFDLPKLHQQIPELLTQHEVANILAATTNLKQKTLLCLCYGCGLRVSELARLLVSDIDSERHLLKVTQGKGRKDRQVILPDSLITLLRKYWHQYHPHHWLFYATDIQQPISINTVQNYFRQAKLRTDISKHGGIHSLRHAYATHQITAGMPIHGLQQQMGHKDIHSTMRYLHWAPRYIEGQTNDLIALMAVCDE